MYMNSLAQHATPLGTTWQAHLSVPPYSSVAYLLGGPPMQNPGPYANPMGSGMQPFASQSTQGGPAFSMPPYSHQPMHMQMSAGRVPASASSTYYM